jgi:hypothetical protein
VSQLPDTLKLGLAVPAAAIALEAGALLREYYQRGVETEYMASPFSASLWDWSIDGRG